MLLGFSCGFNVIRTSLLVFIIEIMRTVFSSGPCNSFYCLGHFKNVYDDDDDESAVSRSNRCSGSCCDIFDQQEATSFALV